MPSSQLTIRQPEINQTSIEIPFWQVEWQGIFFDTLGIPLSDRELPPPEFYSAFYERVFRTYANHESLPPSWREGKTATAQQISREISPGQVVLSYGCGLGYIEKKLAEQRSDIQLYAYDFSDTAGKWIKSDLTSIVYLNKLPPEHKFDVVYLSQVLYALNNDDCIALLIQLSDHLKPDGKIILINTSTTPNENGLTPERSTIKSKLKDVLRPIYRRLSFINGNKRQFWGWQRNNNRYISMARSTTKLALASSYPSARQSFLVFHLSGPTQSLLQPHGFPGAGRMPESRLTTEQPAL